MAANNWLAELVSSCAESEAPEVFFWWGGLAALSATVRKKIWLNRFYYKLYPNIYVFLIAHSGAKKSIPITTVKSIIQSADSARIIVGRNSVQRVLKDLAQVKAGTNGHLSKDAQAMLISGELAAFFVKDPDAMTILTDLHDTHAYEKEWINSLKSTGIDTLRQPCISLLGATNEEHFSDAVADKDIKGGFIARTFIVYSNEVGKLNPLTEPPLIIPNITNLAQHLKDLNKIEGEFQWTPLGKRMYEDWYLEFRNTHKSDATGTIGRIGDQVLKIAMLISLAHDFDLRLKEEDIHTAIAAAIECFNGTKQVTLGRGKGSVTAGIRTLMKALIAHPKHCLTKTEILQTFWGEFDIFELDRMTETMKGSGAVEVKKMGKETTYQLTKNVLGLYGIYKKEIN